MSHVTVKIPTALRPFVDNATLLRENADTVDQALRQIGELHPGFLQRVMTADGEVRPYVNVFVGSADIRSMAGLATTLSDGAVLSIIPAVAGG